ncbi:MAG TPA: VWA domain-containing protein [Polyangiaceae bacterium]|nr:VWA domain-containing protein [Polyangiaceae bacterium]
MIRRSIRGLAGGLLAIGLGAACSRSEPSPSAQSGAAKAEATSVPLDAPGAKGWGDGGPSGAPAPGEPKRGGPADPAKVDPHGGRDRGAPAEARESGLGGAIGGLGHGAPGGGPAPAAAKPAIGGTLAPAEAALDPNGRYATTYRPGGGHLAAFDAAVARGVVPAGEREVVAEVGARYAPDFAVPAGKALAMKAELERSAPPPAGGPLHLRLALRSAQAAAKARPHLSVHLVLDVSGSMAGEAIENARRASAALVDKLDAGDDFSLVTFSSDAQVLVPDGPVGPRRAAIKKSIEGVREGGGTNIGAGLERAYAQAATPAIPADAVRVVLLLSDGRANGGVTGLGPLSRMALDAFQKGVQTSTFGLGGDFDGPLMSAIADDGAGGYYYLRTPDQIAPALATELDRRLDPVATAVEVRVRLKPGVKLLHVYGSRRLGDAEAARVRAQEVAADEQAERRDRIKQDRQDDAAGGLRFFLPAFARDDGHSILLKLLAPEGAGKRDLALVELKYKDRLAKKNAVDELPVSFAYAANDAESAASRNGSVARTAQGFAAGEALARAAELIARGERAPAAALLGEREGILREAARALGEPLFEREADRLARLRSYADGGASGLGEPLVLSMLLETAGRGRLR